MRVLRQQRRGRSEHHPVGIPDHAIRVQGCSVRALDVDFSTGNITHSSFMDIAGDAVDFSGSRVELVRLLVRNVKDKGVSVGEASYVSGRDIEMIDTRVGIASKDLSEAEFTRVTMTGGDIGLAAYQKKLEYGSATLTVERLDQNQIATQYLVEPGSSVIVSGRAVPENQARVVELVDREISD